MHVNIIMLQVEINKAHVNISKLHANISYFVFMAQKNSTIDKS